MSVPHSDDALGVSERGNSGKENKMDNFQTGHLHFKIRINLGDLEKISPGLVEITVITGGEWSENGFCRTNSLSKGSDSLPIISRACKDLLNVNYLQQE
jgi:hypothetical protein